MANKRIYDLTEDTSPATGDYLATDKSGEASASKVNLSKFVLASGTVTGAASQAQTFTNGIIAKHIDQLSKINDNVFLVDPLGGGDYTTLSAALAAITTNADNNEFLIIVTGEVAETAAITAKSHVHVLFLPGASVTVTSTSTLNGVDFTSLTNTTWAAASGIKPTIIRAGAVGAASYGLYTTGCDSTVRLVNLYVNNATTGSASCYGIFNSSSSTPTMSECTGVGGAGGVSCFGIYNGSSSPTMNNCRGIGGAGGASCHGIYNISSSPVMTNCVGTGGAGGTNCYGIFNNNSSPTMTNCVATGGAGGASCYGIFNNMSSPVMENCVGTGGAGGANCYGIANTSGGPTMTNCFGIGGRGGTGCYGILNNNSSIPLMTGCVGIGGGARRIQTSATIAASSRQEDTFQPTASHPYRITGIAINVTAAAAAGVTLTLRDATGGGGNALSAAQAVETTGYKYFPITGHRVITAGNNVFAYLSASDATLAYTAYYTYETCYGTSYGLYQDTDAAVTVQDCSFFSNAASPAVYVSNNGDNLSVFIGGTARSGRNDGTREKAFVCQSAWNPGQVYNMVLDGGNTNLTAAAGTANGSNIEL